MKNQLAALACLLVAACGAALPEGARPPAYVRQFHTAHYGLTTAFSAYAPAAASALVAAGAIPLSDSDERLRFAPAGEEDPARGAVLSLREGEEGELVVQWKLDGASRGAAEGLRRLARLAIKVPGVGPRQGEEDTAPPESLPDSPEPSASAAVSSAPSAAFSAAPASSASASARPAKGKPTPPRRK